MIRTRLKVIDKYVAYKELNKEEVYIFLESDSLKTQMMYNPDTQHLVMDMHYAEELQTVVPLIGRRFSNSFVEELEEPEILFTNRGVSITDKLVPAEDCKTIYGSELYRNFLWKYALPNGDLDTAEILKMERPKENISVQMLFDGYKRTELMLMTILDKLQELTEDTVSIKDATAIAIGITGFNSRKQLDYYKKVVRLHSKET